MKMSSILAKVLLAGTLSSVMAFAEITVDKSNGVLSIVSESGNTMRVKIIAPDDSVIVDKEVPGAYTWTPTGKDGAYRYDAHDVSAAKISAEDMENIESMKAAITKISSEANDYAGGGIEIVNGQIKTYPKQED